MPAFHDVSFPLSIAFGSQGGPERRTQIVSLASGHEERNSPWAASRRRYDAGSGIASLDDLHTLIAFFEARRGRLHGFRFKDHADFKSCAPGVAANALDQLLGTGDGVRTAFQLQKAYGSTPHEFVRSIAKPVTGSVMVAVNGTPLTASAFSVDVTTGVVTLSAPPAAGQAVTAGFLFDVPVRFDADRLDINLASFRAGEAPSIPLVELRLP
ncbi:MAG TPA: DUF2460 domain-containing protein [Micropepsaceae bacterium]|nr:DUF2460 domain-containing protein [Micropepsaceae bacterium]